MQRQDLQARLRSAHANMISGQYDSARAELEHLVAEGESQALLYLGWMHENGLGGPTDTGLATAYYRELCDAGDAAGCFYAASLAFRQESASEALDLYVRAANAGHASGAYWAAALYGGEGGLVPDREREGLYLSKAASLGHAFAKRDIAKKRLLAAGPLHEKIFAALEFGWTVLCGLFRIARNADDPRVR